MYPFQWQRLCLFSSHRFSMTRYLWPMIGMLLACQLAWSKEPSVMIPQPSSNAQKLYEAAKADLLQIRVLLKDGRTQASVGSGFLIGQSNLVVTNYHVISQLVMYEGKYVGEFVDTNKQHGALKLVAVDVLHDLAVLKVDKTGTGFFKLDDSLPTLSQGEYLYSLGNPLDLGFAISEGTYNGVVRRSFYDQYLFTGAINAGMSGGPNITANGEVSGVNVSKRIDGELVSFLVPAKYIRTLLTRAKTQIDVAQTFKKNVAKQLLQHQNLIVDKILSEPLQIRDLGHYQVPVRESEQLRCWGSVMNKPKAHFDQSDIRCSMEHAIFISGYLQVSDVSISHQYTKATKMGRLRFSRLQSESFANERFGRAKSRYVTTPECQESFVENASLPLRAVLCVKAYRQFEGLYDFSLLTVSADQDLASVESRFDFRTVSYENGLKITKRFLNAIQVAE